MLNAFPEAVGPDGQSTLSVCPATCGLERTVSSYKGVRNFNSLGRNLGRRERQGVNKVSLGWGILQAMLRRWAGGSRRI